ncbi:MAG TPA: RsmD family RNA methyltransferase [Allosphingosinicella sp.]|nr:RsmD family RNA methyltransferase [Allosphingosinicella sp.]
MRIIAGRWRGRPLVAPPGLATRPTSDRTREGLFSMLTSRLGTFEGLRVADLFAGSGALGLEALSRGAAHAFFVERGPEAVKAIRANIARLDAAGEVLPGSAEHVRIPGEIHLAFLDPPYGSGLAASILPRLSLAAGALVTVETGRGEAVGADGFESEAERIYGKAKITLLRRRGEAPISARR